MIDLEIFSSGQQQPGPSPDQPGGTVFRGILTKTDTGAELRTRDTLHTVSHTQQDTVLTMVTGL